MSSNYSNGNKPIKDISEYNAFIKTYTDNKYEDITSNFKDNNIKFGDINIKLIYKLEDVKNLIFLSNNQELVIVLLNKDLNNLYHIIISKNVNIDSKNSVKLGNIITFEWDTISNNNTLLFVILGILIFLLMLFVIYYTVIKKRNISKDIDNNI